MKTRERFVATMRFESVDRLPKMEWATWWDKTIARWKEEGLPADLNDPLEIAVHLGLDRIRQVWIPRHRAGMPAPAHHGAPLIHSRQDYLDLKQYLYPDPEEVLDAALFEACNKEQEAGDLVLWITFDGFFWFPRTLFGIAEHMMAFYTDADLMAEMNQDLLEYHLRVLDWMAPLARPDFMTFGEDMSYNKGPMISKELFDSALAPYYRQLIPRIKERGIVPVLDSDGDIEQLIPWYKEVGMDGFLPMERQAGCDVAAYRRDHPDTRFIGAFDKMVMPKGEQAMRAEFERLLPVMRTGGFVPSVDHQTPPSVSFDQYKTYLSLLDEYCHRAVEKV